MTMQVSHISSVIVELMVQVNITDLPINNQRWSCRSTGQTAVNQRWSYKQSGNDGDRIAVSKRLSEFIKWRKLEPSGFDSKIRWSILTNYYRASMAQYANHCTSARITRWSNHCSRTRTSATWNEQNRNNIEEYRNIAHSTVIDYRTYSLSRSFSNHLRGICCECL